MEVNPEAVNPAPDIQQPLIAAEVIQEVSTEPETLWKVGINNNPLKNIFSYLSLLDMSESASTSKAFNDSMNQVIIEHKLWRPIGIPDREFLEIFNPFRCPGELLFHKIVISGLVRDFGRVVNSIDLESQMLSPIELACYRGYVETVRYLLENYEYRPKRLSYSLEYAANKGSKPVIEMLLARRVNTRYVNLALARCIDKKFFDCAIIIMQDNRACLSFNQSSHIRRIFRHDAEAAEKLINMKRKLKGKDYKMIEKVTEILKKKCIKEMTRQQSLVQSIRKRKKEKGDDGKGGVLKPKRRTLLSSVSSDFGSPFGSGVDAFLIQQMDDREKILQTEVAKLDEESKKTQKQKMEEMQHKFRVQMEKKFNIQSYDKN